MIYHGIPWPWYTIAVCEGFIGYWTYQRLWLGYTLRRALQGLLAIPASAGHSMYCTVLYCIYNIYNISYHIIYVWYTMVYHGIPGGIP